MGKTDSGRLAALDLLRLVAALAVLPFHYLFRGAIVGDLDVGYPAAAPLLITEYAPFFASGILAQHIVAKGRSPAALVLLAVAFLISCRTITFPQARMQLHYGAAIPYPALFAANVVVHGVFAGAILLRSAVPSSRTVLMLGGLTYPLHLLHQFIGYISLNALALQIDKNAAFFHRLLRRHDDNKIRKLPPSNRRTNVPEIRNMRFVETKTPEQQGCLMLHRTRRLFVRQQAAVINSI